MANLRDKWRLIKAVIKSDESILITVNSEEFDYFDTTTTPMAFSLFNHIRKYVPRWYGAWLTNNGKK